MKLEDQVCSLELSKRLKELGVKQESLFYWVREKTNENRKYRDLMLKRGSLFIPLDDEPYYKSYEPNSCRFESAFTVAELGKMLPGCSYTRKSTNPKGFWAVVTDGLGVEHMTESETEADARAKLICYLIENGDMKP